MNLKAIIVDLDGTLADITIRRKYLSGEKKDWKNFNSSVSSDTLNEWCREIMLRMATDHQIIIVSGRTDLLKAETIQWLDQFQVPYHYLFMRQDRDNRDDRIIKKEIYDNFIKLRFNVLFVLDDRAKVVSMWREQGLVCLQCDSGNF